MIQEYLFVNGENRSQVEQYRPEKVTVHIYDIDNTDCWIATYSIAGENEDSASVLSKVNKYIIDNYHPTVLANGCAAYYNKLLYPIINGFERKLRKLLYLKSALHKGDKSGDNIKNLESKDLGEIFTILFTDEQFVKNLKATINNKTWQFTKQEIRAVLDILDEETTWDTLIGTDSVPLLRNNFIKAKDYRNDVMHAHDIDTKLFREAKRLFEQINNQLEAETKKIIDIAENNPEVVDRPDYNENLSTVLERSKQSFNYPKVLSVIDDPISQKYSVFSRPHSFDILGKTLIDDYDSIKINDDVINRVRVLDSELHSLSAVVGDLSTKLKLPEIDPPILRTTLSNAEDVLSIGSGISGSLNDTLLSAKNPIDISLDRKVLVKK